MRFAIVVIVAVSIFVIVGISIAQDSRQSSSQEPISQIAEEDLKWNESLKKDIDESINFYSKDPVSSLLTFKGVLGREKDVPDPNQKVWLEKKIADLQPKALAILKQDYDTATRAIDLRGMVIASIVADKIAKDYIKLEPSFSEISSKVYSGSKDAMLIFHITDTTAEITNGGYAESDGINTVSITPKDDSCQLIRVKANVENTNSEKDKSYILWALDDLKRLITPIYLSTKIEKVVEPYRWLDDSFILLLTPDMKLFPCLHVCRNSNFYFSPITIPGEGGRAINLPYLLKKGEKIDIDVIFGIPKATENYQLFIYGAAPAKISVAKK